MKKLFVLTLLFLLLPVSAQAHSGLVSSDPADGETMGEALTEIRIEFDLPIQLGNLKVISEAGEEVSIPNVQADGQTLVGKLDEELRPGIYEIEWDVISQDGHKVEGVIGFAAADTDPEEIEPEITETASPEPITAAQQEDTEGFPLLTAILLVALILAVVLIVVVVRRK